LVFVTVCGLKFELNDLHQDHPGKSTWTSLHRMTILLLLMLLSTVSSFAISQYLGTYLT